MKFAALTLAALLGVAESEPVMAQAAGSHATGASAQPTVAYRLAAPTSADDGPQALILIDPQSPNYGKICQRFATSLSPANGAGASRFVDWPAPSASTSLDCARGAAAYDARYSIQLRERFETAGQQMIVIVAPDHGRLCNFGYVFLDPSDSESTIARKYAKIDLRLKKRNFGWFDRNSRLDEEFGEYAITSPMHLIRGAGRLVIDDCLDPPL